MRSSELFSVCGYKVISERLHSNASRVQAVAEVRIGINCVTRSAVGVGPVHALDSALRQCLAADFPELDNVRLSDYKVSVVDATHGTSAQVRVVVEATDGEGTWNAGCVSSNVIDASFEALCSTAIIGIMRGRAAREVPA